jgi:cytochrome bd-type quinol oxidase subunit 2
VSQRGAQVLVLALVVAGLGYLVVRSVDNWEDWIVFAIIVLTALGAAVAIYPRIYAKRKRTISRASAPPPRRRSP